MNGLNGLLRTLKERGIRLTADGDRLRYEAPTGSVDAPLLAALREHKPALLALLSGPDQYARDDATAITRRSLPQKRMLSMQQESLWRAERIEGGCRALHLPLIARFAVVLEAGRLHAAMARLLERHEELCSLFVGEGNQWYRMLAPRDRFVLETEAIAHPIDRDDRYLLCRLLEFMDNPFDLERDLPLRARLVTGERESLLCLVIHHTAADAVSIGILLQELAELYAGVSLPDDAQAPRYADYAVWQRRTEYIAQAERAAESYAALLGELPPLHSLPTDRPRRSTNPMHGRRLIRQLSADLMTAVEHLAISHDATLFMALETVFMALLGKLSGEPTVIIGTPVANREAAVLDSVVGSFVNMLVIRVGLHAADSFASLIAKVRESNAHAYACQSVWQDLLRSRLSMQRTASHQALYQITLGLQPAAPSLCLDGVKGEVWDLERSVSQHDLGLDLAPSRDGYRARWEFNGELFDSATIAQFADGFERLLQAVLDAPQRPLAELFVDAGPETFAAGVEPGRRESLDRTFNAIATQHPHSLALVCDGYRLSYMQLQARAHQLGRWLRRQGVKTGDYVALSTEICVDTYVALLAITICGAAYVPIDPGYPIERIASMLDDAKPHLVLAGSTLGETLRAGSTAIPIYSYGEASSAATIENDGAFCEPVSLPEHSRPAYVVFTSGSTGRAKGVSITHAGVARLAATEPWLTLGPGRVCLQAATLAFDAATFELWSCWLQGACVVVADRETLLSPTSLLALLREHAVDTAFFTTAYFNRLVATSPEVLGVLDTVLFGGEAVNNIVVARALAACPGTRLVHVYGPTENTTFSSGHVVEAIDVEQERPIPIGSPLRGDIARVLDDALQPVPAGAIGELCLGGSGLALGYIGLPRLTAQAFVPDPFAEMPGARLYRSGDVVRRLPCGEFEFVSRRDNQVKVNGYRIELKEIEAAVMRHVPEAQDCVATVREDGHGKKNVCCYIVMRLRFGENAEAVTSAAFASLPLYARPHRSWLVEALPLTANGKIDWSLLPSPFEVAHVSPVDGEWSALERSVAEVWLEVAGVQATSPESDFFAMGGDSLRGMAVWHELQQRWGVELRLKQFLSEPSIAAIARLIADGLATKQGAELREVEL